jgi:hypothetical protein
MLDSDALHNAAGTLPPATDVKTTEACAADGKSAKGIVGRCRAVARGSAPTRAQGQPKQREGEERGGEDDQVQTAITAARDRRAPWTKNSNAIPISLPNATIRANLSRHARMIAKTTTPMIAGVNSSGTKRANSADGFAGGLWAGGCQGKTTSLNRLSRGYCR